MKNKLLELETLHQFNNCFGNKTLHPMVSAVDLSKSSLTDHTIKVNFYTILLIEGECTDFMYGRKYYDYSNATLLFLSLGQSIQINKKKPLPQNGWLLAFHPDLIQGTALGISIDKYKFFSYYANEALHLSLREKLKTIECLTNIEQELQHDIDRHSQKIISKHIELFLDYCVRFYERQFITRDEINKEILSKMELLLDEYIQSGRLKSKVLPSVKYCSDSLNLSPHYFSDLLRFETGKDIDGYFQLKRIEVAKKMLLSSENNVYQITELLGYPSIQYFSKLFQKLTGTSPSEYRINQN